MSDTPDSEKLKKMRDRIESLRGLCKTAVGYLRDANAFHQADEIASLIGDMEPPLNKDMVSELAAAQAEIAALRKDAEYADLLRWAESHPEIAYNAISSWWAQTGRGCREITFMFSNCIKGAKRGVD